MINSMGQFLGEEVKRVMREMSDSHVDRRQNIRGSENDQLPRPRQDRPGARRVEGQYKDGADVQLRLSLLMIDDIAIGGCNAEIYNMIAAEIQDGSLLSADPSLCRWPMAAAIPDMSPMTRHLASRPSRFCRRAASPDMPRAPSSMVSWT